MALILIVDDAQFSRKIICKTVQKLGYDIVEASDGRQALEMIDSHDPDCILLDLLMPDFDGREVLKILREKQSKIPAIVITADIQETSRQQCLDLGAMAVINKPPKPNEIGNALEQALKLTQENSP